MNISPIFLYGKAASHEDFTWAGTEAPPLEIRAAASAWFRCHADGPSSGQTVAIVRNPEDSSLWVIRVSLDGTDAGGRVAHLLFAGRFDESATELNIGTALMVAYIKKLPDRAAWEAKRCKLPSPISPWPAEPERLPLLLAQRVLELAKASVAGSPATVASLTARLGVDAFEWFAASSGVLPAALLPQTPGILIVTPPPEGPRPSPEVRALFENETVSFHALLRAAPELARRRFLVSLAVSGREGDDPGGSHLLSDLEFEWLFNAPSPAGRVSALLRAGASQAHRVTCAGALASPEEVEAVKSRLDQRSEAQALSLAPLLANHQCLDLFREIFGPGAPGSEHFFTSGARAWWEYLLAPETVPEPPEETRLAALEELSQHNMFSRLPLSTLARRHAWPFLGSAFRSRFGNTASSRQVVSWLCDGRPPARLIEIPPELEPGADWIRYMDAERLEALGGWMTGSGGAIRWWRAALRAHPVFASIDPADLNGSWREARGWLAVAEAYESRLPRERLFAMLARWKAEGGASWNDATAADMLRRGGFDASVFEHIAVADLDGATARLVIENLVWLHHAGLADPEAIFSRLPLAAVAQALKGARLDQNLGALLDLGGPGPTQPPGAGLPPTFGGVLPRLLGAREFWGRWQDGIPQPVLDWLARQTETLPASQIVAAVQRARNCQALPEEPVLSLVADALPCRSVIHLLLAAAGGPREPEARALLASKSLRERPLLAQWLRTRLWNPAQAAPPLPQVEDPELKELLPALDLPEILRLLMARSDTAPLSEDLVEAIRSKSRRSDFPWGFAQLPAHLSAIFQPASHF